MFTITGEGAQDSPRRGKRRRGRPPGPTAQSEETRRRLYETAVGLIAAKGYEATTLREIAERAGVSPGLLYRYFPGKRAVVLALYEESTAQFARRTQSLPAGRWRDRFLFALRASLAALAPHRPAMSALVPVLVGGRDEGLFAPATAFSRERVESVFVAAVSGAKDAPKAADAVALGRVLYLVHLGVVLWWLLDRSEGQRSTGRLVALLERALAPFSLAFKLGTVRGLVRDLDAVARNALLGEAT